MTIIITQEGLEHLTETELHSKFYQILNSMARMHSSVPKCPLAQASLENVRRALTRKRLKPSPSLRF